MTRVSNNFADLSTNVNAEALSYTSVDDTSISSCKDYLGAYSRAPSYVDKNRMKVLAQMMPTYNYNTETGGTLAMDACTLPQQALRTYDVDDMMGNFQCILQDERKTPVKLSSGKRAEDVIKGCVMKFNPDNSIYTDGDTYNTGEKIDYYLDNAYGVLDAENRMHIKQLRDKIAELTEQKRILEEIDLPCAHDGRMNAMREYNKVKTDCNYYRASYNYIMEHFSQLIYVINIGIMTYQKHAEDIKQSLNDHHKENKLTKITRNIQELSFITIYWGSYRRGNKYTFEKPLLNLNINNINKREEYALGVHEIPYVGGIPDDEARSVYIPPGMNCIMYEHPNFRGTAVTFDIPGWPKNPYPVTHPDFSQIITRASPSSHGRGYTTNFNDKMSSMKIFGAFQSSYHNDVVELTTNIRKYESTPAQNDRLFTNEDTGTHGVTLYEHCNFEGRSYFAEQGRYSAKDIGLDHTISSIKVPHGFTVTIYENPDFKGKSTTITKDVPCLVDVPICNSVNWNDKVSSIIISRT